MSVAIRHIELDDGIPDIRLPDGYSELLVLITLRGIPVGDVCIRTDEQVVRSRLIASRVIECHHDRLVELLVHKKLSIRETHPLRDRHSIDVIVCTSDRPDHLARCLPAIMDAAHVRNVIVVDNGLDCEATYEIVRSCGARYVREKKRGLSFARNAGLRASDAEFVAFTDDDVVVDPMWLDGILKSFRSDEAIACVTGLIMPLELDTPAQRLFEGYSDGGMRRGYRRRMFDRTNISPLAAGQIGVGANMAFRSCVLRKAGGFDEALGVGTPAWAGEEADMFYRLLMRGCKICYEPSALVWHCHRREMDQLSKQLWGYSIGVYAFLTKVLLEHRDINALRTGLSWFRSHHLRNTLLGLVGKASQPLNLTLVEIQGALLGPLAYLRAKAHVSYVRLMEGSERRMSINRTDDVYPGRLSPIRYAWITLRRAAVGSRGRMDD